MRNAIEPQRISDVGHDEALRLVAVVDRVLEVTTVVVLLVRVERLREALRQVLAASYPGLGNAGCASTNSAACERAAASNLRMRIARPPSFSVRYRVERPGRIR